jgi:hypothetical protein
MNRTLERTRSIMAPGNPVPPGAFGDSWKDSRGQAAFRQIVTQPGGGSIAARQADPPRVFRRRIRRWMLAGLAAIVVMVGSGAVLISGSAAGPGQLGTAPMLDYLLAGVSAPARARQLPPARSLLLHLGAVADRQLAIPQPAGADVGYVLTNEWYMSVAVAGGTNTVAIIPEVDKTWTTPGGMARQLQLRGKPLPGPVGSLRTLRAAESRQPVSDSTSRTTEEFGPLARGLATNPARLRAQLLGASEYRDDPRRVPAGYQLFGVIADLHHQLVAPRLEAAIWRVLAGQQDVRYLGTVTDRAGRRGVAVATTDSGERLVLIISPSTGRLLGEEHIFLTNPGALNVRTFPMVASYVAYLSRGWAVSTATVPGPRRTAESQQRRRPW